MSILTLTIELATLAILLQSAEHRVGIPPANCMFEQGPFLTPWKILCLPLGAQGVEAEERCKFGLEAILWMDHNPEEFICNHGLVWTHGSALVHTLACAGRYATTMS